MKLTFEKQAFNQLLFLDLLITNNGDNFLTSFSGKNHYTGLYTDYLSFTSLFIYNERTARKEPLPKSFY